MRITKSRVAGLGLNYMQECDQCIYCWNQELNQRFHPENVGNLGINYDISELLNQIQRNEIPTPYAEEECQFYDRGQYDIIFASKTEPFHKAALDLPARILAILSQYPALASRIRILSKRDYHVFLPLIPRSMLLGATITTLDSEQARLYQPGASDPWGMVTLLQDAHTQGFQTWLVVEPYFSKMDLLTLIVSHLPFLSELWIGRLNHKDRSSYEIMLDSEISAVVFRVILWAREHAPQMKIRIKKELQREIQRLHPKPQVIQEPDTLISLHGHESFEVNPNLRRQIQWAATCGICGSNTIYPILPTSRRDRLRKELHVCSGCFNQNISTEVSINGS